MKLYPADYEESNTSYGYSVELLGQSSHQVQLIKKKTVAYQSIQFVGQVNQILSSMSTPLEEALYLKIIWKLVLPERAQSYTAESL
ncbi:MAG: hypothetical protein ACMUEM_04830 [Flavobacteriales bacterium AspAUS03]